MDESVGRALFGGGRWIIAVGMLVVAAAPAIMTWVQWPS